MENVKEIFSSRLKSARIMRGMSLDSLSVQIGGEVSKQTLSNYETCVSFPNSTVLIKLANALGVKSDYFFRNYYIEIKDIEFRKKKKFPQKRINAITEEVKDRISRYLEIEDILNIKKVWSDIHFEVKTAKDVNLAVEKLREIWHLGEDGISNTVEMLEDNGIILIELKSNEQDVDFDGLCGWANGRPFIVLSESFSPERKRFTALHELGHIVMKINDLKSDNSEKFCDIFANNMLVSDRLIIDKIGNKRKDISMEELIDIQLHYGISPCAMMYRVYELDIISKNRLQGFFVKRNKYPNFKELVDKPRYKNENTFRFERLVFKALASEIISESKAAELLNKSVLEIHKLLALV